MCFVLQIRLALTTDPRQSMQVEEKMGSTPFFVCSYKKCVELLFLIMYTLEGVGGLCL